MAKLSVTETEFEVAQRLATMIYSNHIDTLHLSQGEAEKLLPSLGKKITELELHPTWNHATGTVLVSRGGDVIRKRIVFGRQYLTSLFEERHQSLLDGFAELIVALYVKNIGEEPLVEKIAVLLAEKHDNLSLGQARAAVKRLLGRSLSGKERTDLHRLRNKLSAYKKLIEGIDYVAFTDVKKMRKEIPEYNREYDYQVFLRCSKCGETQELGRDLIEDPVHHELPMQLNWRFQDRGSSPTASDKSSPADLEKIVWAGPRELQDAISDVKSYLKEHEVEEKVDPHKAYFVCSVCDLSLEISEEKMWEMNLAGDDYELPTHHGQPMQVKILTENTPPDTKKMIKVFEELSRRGEDLMEYRIFHCLKCGEFVVIHRDELKEIPKHHGQMMREGHLSVVG